MTTSQGRGKEKNKAFQNKPQQGRMVQFYKPLTTNSKHTHPKLKGEGKSSEKLGKQRMVTWNSRLWTFLTFLTLEDV